MSDPAYERIRNAKVTVEEIDKRTGEIGPPGTAHVTAPYAFVRLEPFCIPTPWGSAPRLDKPHPEGISGELTVDWIAESTILIGGPKDRDEPRITFFRTGEGDDTIAIPGSSLRGALRALLEPMTMARMEHVDRDATYSVRDLGGKHKNRWKATLDALGGAKAAGKAFIRPKPGDVAGNWNEPAWEWKKVAGERISTAALLAHFRTMGRAINAVEFAGASVSRKFELLGIRPDHECRFEQCPDGTFTPVAPSQQRPGHHYRTGWLVLSGVDPNYGKKHEHVFFTDGLESAAWQPIATDDLARFKFIHSRIARGDRTAGARGTLDFWKEAFAAGEATMVPVFYFHRPPYAGGTLPGGLILSLARSFKMPHARSTGAVLGQQRQSAEAEPALDFVQALFGHVPHQGEDMAPPPDQPRKAAWRGRVRFSDAPLAEAPRVRTQEQSGVTSAPRPSFWPYYLEPKTGGEAAAPVDWSDAGANLAGFKRYPVRKAQSPFVQAPGGTQGNSNANILNTMAFVDPGPAGLRFRGRIRFHNLLPAELGALLFAIEFGTPERDDAPHRHAIGRGKAQGHGRVRARIDAGASRFERNDGATTIWPALAADCVAAFQGFVAAQYGRLKGMATVPEFHAIPAVAQTLAMQDPAIGDALKDRLVYPGVPSAEAVVLGDATLDAYGLIGNAAKLGNPAARLPRYPTSREQG